MDPYFDIDIPRLERSIAANVERTRKTQRGRQDDHDAIGWFFAHLEKKCKTRGSKAKLRGIVWKIICLLDGDGCQKSHCKSCSSYYPRNCMKGLNPKTCKDNKKYLEKKALRESRANAAAEAGEGVR